MSFESEYWGDCCNTYDEDQKHYVYAQYMGLMTVGYSFSMSGKSVVDIGGGPTSMLLKTTNLGKGLVVDPLLYPQWTYARYDAKKIDCLVIRGEDFIGNDKFDEAWIYNCLQHTDDPELIIQNAKRAAKIVRLFEWVDIPPHEGHPIELTKENLDQWLGKEGSTTQLARSGCYGKAYYNIV
jgi:SAM-dependent methyltransferase